MKQLQSFDEFENALRNESIPSVDIEKIKLYSNITKSSNGFSAKKLSAAVLVALLTLSLSVFAYAAYNSWQLKNAKGEVILELSEIEQQEMEKSKISDKFSQDTKDIRISILKALEKGEGAIFVSTAGYEFDKQSTLLQNITYFTDSDKAKEASNVQFAIPSVFPEEYHLSDITMEFESSLPYSQLKDACEELYNEAKEKGLDYNYKKVSLTKVPRNISINYRNRDNGHISIFIISGGKIQMSNLEASSVEKLETNGLEILHLQPTTERPNESYIFVKEVNGRNLLYDLSLNKAIDKDTIIKMINSLD